jgi:hypothetical protein
MTSTGSSKKSNTPKYGQSWKKEKFHDLELPSGNVCQVRRPGVQGLIKAGVLESMDVLTGLVQQTTLPKAEGKVVVDKDKMMQNPDSVRSMIDILDDIVLYAVNRPAVLDKYWRYQGDDETAPHYDPQKAGERVLDSNNKPIEIKAKDRLQDDEADEDADPIIYVDEVDLEDKMFLMNYVVGGSRDLAQFRAATQEALGGVHDGEGARPTAE